MYTYQIKLLTFVPFIFKLFCSHRNISQYFTPKSPLVQEEVQIPQYFYLNYVSIFLIFNNSKLKLKYQNKLLDLIDIIFTFYTNIIHFFTFILYKLIRYKINIKKSIILVFFFVRS
jgi:hypothetical protein